MSRILWKGSIFVLMDQRKVGLPDYYVLLYTLNLNTQQNINVFLNVFAPLYA